MILSKAEYFYLWLQNLSSSSSLLFFFSTEFLSRSLDGGRALWLEKTGQHNIHSIILHRRGWREDSWKILYWDERESDEKKENIFQEVTHGKKDKSHISCRAINLRLREFLIISDNAFFFSFSGRDDARQQKRKIL